jgi:uncharacterized protein (UPF0332 family)
MGNPNAAGDRIRYPKCLNPTAPQSDQLPKPYYTLDYQFHLADQALGEARNLLKANYYTSSISHSFQVAHRCAAGLLFGIQARVQTERDVGIGFESAFVSGGHAPPRYAQIYRRLAEARRKADFEFEYLGTREEAQEYLQLAEAFHEEAQRLRSLVATA